MPRRATRIEPIHSFTGGVNLRDDAFQLQDDELEDAFNVAVLPTGGVERRRTIADWINAAIGSGEMKNLWAFIRSSTAYALVVQRGQNLAHIDQANTITNIALASATTGTMHAATLSRITGASAEVPNLYIQRNAEFAAVRLDGTTATVLGVAFNDNLAAAAGGNMPQAKYVCSHLTYCFVAHTVETAVTRKNRIRWSHPGEPEDWRTNDYIDVGAGDEGDAIVGLASINDQLLIFKTRSIWVLRGYSPDSFTVQRLTGDVGGIGQRSIAVGQRGVAWFDAKRGAFAYDGKDITHLWPKLERVIGTSQLPLTSIGEVAMCWFGDKLFASVPWNTATVNARTFVFDPKLGRDGAWYIYGYGVRAMVDFRPTSTLRWFLAIPSSWSDNQNTIRQSHVGGTLSGTSFVTAGFVVQLEAATAAADDLGNSVNYSFESLFYSSWFDAGSGTLRKRWRRPYFVLAADSAASVNVQVFRDYDRGFGRTREFNLQLNPGSAGGTVWGNNWGTLFWTGELTGEEIDRGSGLGRAYAIQLRIQGPLAVPWHLNAIDFRYIPTRVR